MIQEEEARQDLSVIGGVNWFLSVPYIIDISLVLLKLPGQLETHCLGPRRPMYLGINVFLP